MLDPGHVFEAGRQVSQSGSVGVDGKEVLDFRGDVPRHDEGSLPRRRDSGSAGQQSRSENCEAKDVSHSREDANARL